MRLLRTKISLTKIFAELTPVFVSIAMYQVFEILISEGE